MKLLHFILLVIAAISIFSCSGSGQGAKHDDAQSEEQARLDSIRKDSIQKAQIIKDSLSMIAWGDAKYGMSRKEVKQTVAFKGGEAAGNAVDMTYKNMRKVANTFGLDRLNSIAAVFSEDELVNVVMRSWKTDALNQDKLTDDCSIIANNFIERYGKPSYINENASWGDIKAWGEISLMEWEIEGMNGTKHIRIEMHRYEYEYLYEIHIWNDGFPKKKHIPTPEEIEKEKKEKAEKDMVKATSF